MQEATRKDVERAFGVLQARWHIISRPSRLWTSNRVAIIMKTCVILHNMIIADEGSPSPDLSPQDIACPPGGTPEDYSSSNFVLPEISRFSGGVQGYNAIQLKAITEHHLLRKDLIEHLWNMKGNSSFGI
jgi:hypothetical protein